MSKTTERNKLKLAAPVISLCVYYGENERDGPFSLKDMLEIPVNRGLVIGAITESQQLIDHALESEREGGQMNMCNALEELRLEGRLEGQREGRLEGIRATIRTCKKFSISEEDTLQNIMKEFSLSQGDAANYMKKYW